MASPTDIHYDHLHFYVDALKPLDHYKAIEDRLNSFTDEAAKW